MKTVLLLFAFAFLLQYKGYAQDGKRLYREGVAAAKKGEIDFAFISFHRLLLDFPESKYREQALFAVGEYYFSIGGYNDAVRHFTQLADDFPQAQNRPFALAYLLAMAKKSGTDDRVAQIEKELIGSQQLSLLFREFKEIQYTSALDKHYKALNFIDKILICVEDEPLAEISF
ncbi:tol-pal system YbgF family protein [Candidatus Omnitrophota bacterium]